MREFQDKRQRRLIIYSWPVSVGLTILLIMLSGSVYRLYEKQRFISVERQSLFEEVSRLRARQSELEQEILDLATDRGLEEVIRQNFNVVKPGEKVITFVFDRIATNTAQTSPQSWWQKFVHWFQ